jgi:hypothetical protein
MPEKRAYPHLPERQLRLPQHLLSESHQAPASAQQRAALPGIEVQEQLPLAHCPGPAQYWPRARRQMPSRALQLSSGPQVSPQPRTPPQPSAAPPQ